MLSRSSLLPKNTVAGHIALCFYFPYHVVLALTLNCNQEPNKQFDGLMAWKIDMTVSSLI